MLHFDDIVFGPIFSRRLGSSLGVNILPTTGKLCNFEVISKLAAEDLCVEVGGGSRDEERIKAYLAAGVKRVILGSAAIENPGFAAEMAQKYGEAIAVGVDASEGKVAIHGWKTITDVDSIEFCKNLVKSGVTTVIYTDISKVFKNRFYIFIFSFIYILRIFFFIQNQHLNHHQSVVYVKKIYSHKTLYHHHHP